MQKYRSLLLRGNRYLSSALVEMGLITLDQQNTATHRLLECINQEDLRKASLLDILVREGILNENDLIDHIVEEMGVGLVNLSNYDFSGSFDRSIDLDLCRVTWTVPFDHVDGFRFLASAYYLSEPVRKEWEQIIRGKCLWYLAPASAIADAIEMIEQEIKTEDSNGKK